MVEAIVIVLVILFAWLYRKIRSKRVVEAEEHFSRA